MSQQWSPQGCISLHQAVIDLASADSPGIDMLGYLSRPWPVPAAVEGTLDPVRAAIASWNPFEHPRKSPEDPAWASLEAARKRLLQALGSNALRVTALFPDGGQSVVDCDIWRRNDAGEALRYATDRMSLWLSAPDFHDWKQPNLRHCESIEGGSNSDLNQVEVNAWFMAYFQAAHDERRPKPKLQDDAFVACIRAFEPRGVSVRTLKAAAAALPVHLKRGRGKSK